MTDAEQHAYLSTLVHYFPDTGKFFSLYSWEMKAEWSRDGYLYLQIGRKRYRSHRLAWFLTHGYWPKLIDHIDRDRANNRIANLRDATPSENSRNRARRRNRHVFHDKNGPRRQRYLVKMRDLNGKLHNFGRYLTEDIAILAAQEARDILGII